MDEKKAVALLKKHSGTEAEFRNVLRHSKKVREIALGISKGIPGVDLDFIKTAAILHDIGRFRYPPGKDSVKHGVEGGEILRREGFEKHARVAERHLGAGISKQDIRQNSLDLPAKDYVPVTAEEKIITYADKLTDGNKKIDFKNAMERYEKEFGKEYAERLTRLKKDIDKLKNGEYQ